MNSKLKSTEWAMYQYEYDMYVDLQVRKTEEMQFWVDELTS